jgi:hypothetical protein
MQPAAYPKLVEGAQAVGGCVGHEQAPKARKKHYSPPWRTRRRFRPRISQTNNLPLDILRHLRNILRFAQIPPIILIRPKRGNSLSLPGQTQI